MAKRITVISLFSGAGGFSTMLYEGYFGGEPWRAHLLLPEALVFLAAGSYLAIRWGRETPRLSLLVAGRPAWGRGRPDATQRALAGVFRRASSVSPIGLLVCSVPSKDHRVGLPSTTVSTWTGRPQRYCKLASVSCASFGRRSIPLCSCRSSNSPRLRKLPSTT